jgi:hypothetical protein
MGNASNFDPEDLVKIFEFMDMIESYQIKLAGYISEGSS